MNNKKQSDPRDGIRIKGMFHLQIEEGGKIVGDSGRVYNKITNAGYLNIVNLIGSSLTGGSVFAAAALGTGGVPSGGDTTQSGEVLATTSAGHSSVKRAALNGATFVTNTSTALRNTATFSSSNSFISATNTIANIGLWDVTGAENTSGRFFAGNTYASSALATNQNVNITYDIIFG